MTWLFLAPRQATAGDFMEDLQNGAVRNYQTGFAEDFEPFNRMALGPFPSGTGPVLVWCTGRVDCHHVDLDELANFAEPTPSSSADSVQYGDEAPDVRRLIDRHSVGDAPTRRQAYPWFGSLLVAWSLMWLGMLFVLITGPQPRCVTKWAMVWLYTLPGGLGLLWALTREAPWSRRAADLPEPDPGPAPGRWTGGWALIAVAASSAFLVGVPEFVKTVLP